MLAGINRPTMKTISLLFVVLLVSVSCLAQVKPKFASQQLVGLLEGEGGSAFQIQTINGVQLKKWFMGLGTGIDWYEYRSIPVFLSLNYDLKMSNRRFFLSADAGTNFPWTKTQGNGFGTLLKSDFDRGLYTNTGIGYKLNLKNSKDGFLIHLGYGTKRLKETQTVSNFCAGGPCAVTTERYDYRMRRISIRIGWLF